MNVNSAKPAIKIITCEYSCLSSLLVARDVPGDVPSSEERGEKAVFAGYQDQRGNLNSAFFLLNLRGEWEVLFHCFFFRVRELFEKPPSKPMRTKMEEQKKWIKTYVFFNICQKSNRIQKLLVLSFLYVSKCLYRKSLVNMGFPQKYMLWFYLNLGSSHSVLCFFGGIMMYDKECEAVMKIKFELRMKLNHNR